EAPEGEERVESEGRLEPVDESVGALALSPGLEENRGGEPESHRAPRDLEHVDDRAGEAAALLRHGGDSRGCRGRVEEPDPETHQDEAGDDRRVAPLRD